MGCNSTKHAEQPGTKNIGSNKSPVKGGSPQKNPRKPIKKLSQGELAKHKAQDILGFIKSGNLPMIHGLIKHHKLGQSVMNLRGPADEFGFLGGEKTSTKEWNPLLIAIASKKIDVVQYFLGDLHISLRHLGKSPVDADGFTEAAAVNEQVFCLLIAIANKDIHMLRELWSHYTAWDYLHLEHLAEILIKDKWGTGLNEVLKSYTTEVIFNSLTMAQRLTFVESLFTKSLTMTPESQRHVHAALQSAPFALFSIDTLI